MATPSADRPHPRAVRPARPRRRLPRRPTPAPPQPPINWFVVGVAGGLAAVAVLAVVIVCAAHRRADTPAVAATRAEPAEVAAAPTPAPLPAEPPAPTAAVPEPGALKSAGSAPPTDVPPGPGPAGFAKGHGEPPAPRFRRRDLSSADELARQLVTAPEIDLDSQHGTSSRLADAARAGTSKSAPPILGPLLARADLHGLPVAMGADCQLGKESAESLQVLSRKLRFHLSQSASKNPLAARTDAAVLRRRLAERQAGAGEAESDPDDWRQEDAVPTLVQMLQPEDRPVRLLLVELLAAIPGRAASAALAGRAVFDISAEVREAAVKALAGRPREEYRGPLLGALRYPWPPAADHAAEALVALDDRESVPRLAALLAEPDPAGPVASAVREFDPALIRKTPRPRETLPTSAVALEDGGRRVRLLADPDDVFAPVKAQGDRVLVVREVVRVNHLRNCLLCHVASTAATDPVRGFVPTPGQPIGPPSAGYGGRDNGLFVRADVTYLRQDFSVAQPVEKSDNWPAHQRYDYVVRARYPTTWEVLRKPPETYPQREAVRWALQQFGAKEG